MRIKLKYFLWILIIYFTYLEFISATSVAVICKPGYIKCNSTGTCISGYKICDGLTNCEDGEDESEKNCKICPNIKPFRCNNVTSKCVQPEFVCNGLNDCGNNEDENQCGRCIPYSKVCDGFTDCIDGEDEKNCDSCIYGAFHCSSSKFCVPSYNVCDGTKNCPNGEDESNCTVCPQPRIKCNATGSTRCIHPDLICNGYNECLDNEDESKCTVCPDARPVKCNVTASMCIYQIYVCSNGVQCPDGEDENQCRYSSIISRTTARKNLSTTISSIGSTSVYNEISAITTPLPDILSKEQCEISLKGPYIGLAVLGATYSALIMALICVLCLYKRQRQRNLSAVNKKVESSGSFGENNPALIQDQNFQAEEKNKIQEKHTSTVPSDQILASQTNQMAVGLVPQNRNSTYVPYAHLERYETLKSHPEYEELNHTSVTGGFKVVHCPLPPSGLPTITNSVLAKECALKF